MRASRGPERGLKHQRGEIPWLHIDNINSLKNKQLVNLKEKALLVIHLNTTQKTHSIKVNSGCVFYEPFLSTTSDDLQKSVKKAKIEIFF